MHKRSQTWEDVYAQLLKKQKKMIDQTFTYLILARVSFSSRDHYWHFNGRLESVFHT